jgi:hypothetical protein
MLANEGKHDAYDNEGKHDANEGAHDAEHDVSLTFVSAPSGRSVSHGTQAWREVEGFIQSGLVGSIHAELAEQTRAPVGQAIHHHSALQQCTGEAEYVDDIHQPFGTVRQCAIHTIHTIHTSYTLYTHHTQEQDYIYSLLKRID